MNIRKYHKFDAKSVARLMRKDSSVSFLDWEDSCFSYIGDQAIIYVAEDKNSQIIGAIIGGFMGFRGTINHLAVSDDARLQGVGSSLVTTLLNDLKQRNILRVFLFCDKSSQANCFWNIQGFSKITTEWTYEVDL